MLSQTKKFFLYARKSTDNEDRQVRSIDDQIAELKELAVKENIIIVKTFIEKQTAKEPGRPVFNSMLASVENSEAVGILVWHPDRLARNSVDGGKIIYLLDTEKLQALKFPTFWFENTPQGKFMLNIAFGQSKYYVDNLSENIKRGIRQKLKNGIWPGFAPLGYVNDREKRIIKPDRTKVPLIRKTFQLYSTGEYPISQVRKIVNNLGLVGKKKGALSNSNYQYILKNPIYYGAIRYNNELYEGIHKPIISKKLFDKCQEVMKQKSKPRAPRLKYYVYRAMFRCAECGCFITTETQKGHNYLRCTKRKIPCQQKYAREEIITKQITKIIQKVSLSDVWAANIIRELEREARKAAQTSVSFAQKLRSELKQIENKLDALLDLQLNGAITQAEYTAKKQKILNQKIEISEKLKAFEQKSNNRFELAIKFVKASNQAQNIALQENREQSRDFLKKIGSNLQIANRNLTFNLKNPWKTVFSAEPSRRRGEAPTVSTQESATWRRVS